jgi:hypothetical protein
LTDSKNSFQLLHSRPIRTGVYKVRSIANASWNEKQCTLVGNDFTNFLEISDWMKSFTPANWDKLSVEKSTIATENDHLTTKILREKRGEKRKSITLRDLIKKGIILHNFRKPQRIIESLMCLL